MAYHVFLSFRGEDTRKTFTDHLYTALSGAGLRTFRDDDGIERGENVKSELDKAIKEARSSIVVFSKDYASSGWCLDELVMILERKRTSSGAGHVVLPVFYDVDPSEVRKQIGSFGEAFCRHEERLNAETNEREKEDFREKVEVWRRALREVADLAGMVLQNQADGHESKFIQEIVREIGGKLNRPVLHVAENPIGIESRVRNINSWLHEPYSRIALIYGMGGIGKTTIAEFAYNMNIERFEASSFLANIRDMSEGPKGLVRLQRQLLSDISKREMEKIRSVDEGISKIKDFIRCKRVLVVLDDVDDRAQVDALIGKRDWFQPWSKIILTTRNSHLLKANEVDETFEVVGLNSAESLELFSWHAFGQGYPIEGYTELTRRLVEHCQGLPLALKVLGSLSSSDHSFDIWEEKLQKLEAIPNSKILKKLQISYDCLDGNDKELFLHIACFFIGKSKNFVIRVLGDLYPTVGIQTLIERCLLTVNRRNKLIMHQLLRQMGREIVHQESPEPGRRSRLWDHKYSFEVLSEKTGTKTIQGLCLDMHMLKKGSRFRENFGVCNVQKRHLVIKRPTNNVGRSSNQVELSTDAFRRMRNLKLLLLNTVEITGRYADFPAKLRCLIWHGFPLTCIPAEFSLKILVHLDLRYSKLEQVWKGEMCMKSLEILNLSFSHGLKNTPNFTGVPNLKKLILKHCISLVKVDESVGVLGSLVLLNLKGCKNLKTLPCEICHLTSLEKLILSGCSKLDHLPAELELMKSMTVLHAGGISLKPRKSPKTWPSFPSSLVELSLSNCSLLSDHLANLGMLSILKYLNLSENPISGLPESIKGLAVLESLNLRKCTRLQSLPELPMNLEMLNVHGCISLKTITNLPNLLTSLHVDMKGCPVVEVQGMFKLQPIGNVDAEVINEMGLSSEMENMGSLEVELCNPLYDAFASIKKGTLQVLYECGICNIFLPRSEVPASWCSNNKVMGSLITFNVPSLPNLKIQALKIYVVFFDPGWRFECVSKEYDYITLNNVTKGVKWAYSPLFRCIPPDNDMVWLSHWKIGNQLILEAGDAVNVSACIREPYLVEEIGVHVVYEEPEEKGSQHHKADSRHQNVTNVGDLSAYQLRPGYYHLCHHGNHQDYYQDKNLELLDEDRTIFREFKRWW